MASVTYEAVTLVYPNAKAPTVNNFDLEVADGEFLVLVGPSGCGKTTLIRCVNRMVQPTGGQVLIDDKDVSSRPPIQLRRSIGYVLQDAGLLPHRSVGDNIGTVLRRFSVNCMADRLLDSSVEYQSNGR